MTHPDPSPSLPDPARPPSTRRTAMVTGGTAGIGRAYADRLAAEGLDLVLVARDPVRLDAVAREIAATHGVAVEQVAADLGDRDDVDRVAARLAEAERPVDWLINNAGFGLKGRFLDNPIDAEQEMLDVLVTAVLRLSHAAFGAMAQRGRGVVVNVSSVASFLPRGTYGAAKSWVNQFGRWAAREYAPAGITVTTVCPGFVRTEFHERMGVQRGSARNVLWLEPDVIVDATFDAVASGRALVVPSKRYRVIVGVTRVIPTGLLQRLQKLGRR